MAYVLSSLSGNLISAASAGYAPTNSGDVSAIASAYQVVSATATQLNAGTAYLTSVNETPISAARAGNAANASLATSAWYDGTGRMISALPDESTVSSIASAYAESAASSKQDTLTFDWDADSAISSINGSALAGGGGAVTGDYVENSAISTASIYVSADGTMATAATSVSSMAFVPTYLKADTTQVTTSNVSTFYYMPSTSPFTTTTGIFSPLQYATGACLAMKANSFWAYYKGNEWYVSNPAAGMLRGEVHTSRGVHISGATGTKSFDVGCSGVSGKTGSNYNWGVYPSGANGVNSYGGWSITREVVSGSRNDGDWWLNRTKVSGTDSSVTWEYGTAEYTQLTSVYDTVSANSASWGGGGGVDSATVSAIASAYVESGVSSKLDTTAQVVTSIGESYPATGGTFISQINGTNIFAVTAHSAGDWIGASSKADSSALSSYALSSDVSGTVDLVSSQSANWGGSALQLSAGAGISLTLSGNVLIIATAV